MGAGTSSQKTALSASATAMTGSGTMNIRDHGSVFIFAETKEVNPTVADDAGKRKRSSKRRSNYSDGSDSEDSAQEGRTKHGGRTHANRPKSPEKPWECSKHKDCKKLSDKICIFTNKKLSESPVSKVYLGVKTSDDGFEEQLAIKVISSYTEKNLREIEILRDLSYHENVISIIHADEWHGKLKYLYIAMEKYGDFNLGSYIKHCREKDIPFNFHQALNFSKQIVNGIHFIHGKNIVHCDLKPSSILLSLCDNFLKICDFGMSKVLRKRTVSQVSTSEEETDGYRAPETYKRNEISKESDIYSLALLLHHLLSYGFHPFGPQPLLWERKITLGKSPDLEGLRLPFRESAKILLKEMLKVSPKQRPSIDKIKEDPLMTSDSIIHVMQSCDEIWDGAIKDTTGQTVLRSKLYRHKHLTNVHELSLKSEKSVVMRAMPYVDIRLLKRVADEEPYGYIVPSSKNELQEMMEKLCEKNEMAWIEFSTDPLHPKVLVLSFCKEYNKIIGFFFPDWDSISSFIGKLEEPENSGTFVSFLRSWNPLAALSRRVRQAGAPEGVRTADTLNVDSPNPDEVQEVSPTDSPHRMSDKTTSLTTHVRNQAVSEMPWDESPPAIALIVLGTKDLHPPSKRGYSGLEPRSGFTDPKRPHLQRDSDPQPSALSEPPRHFTSHSESR